jgi:hypothetical protein
MSVARAPPILVSEMSSPRSLHRFVLVVGDASNDVTSQGDVAVIERLDHVVLVETSMSTAAVMRRAGRPHVHVYSSERAARAALALFQR